MKSSGMGRNKCDQCICKTCMIAHINGGAPGCGDCKKCETDPVGENVTNCPDYYCPNDFLFGKFLYKKYIIGVDLNEKDS